MVESCTCMLCSCASRHLGCLSGRSCADGTPARMHNRNSFLRIDITCVQCCTLACSTTHVQARPKCYTHAWMELLRVCTTGRVFSGWTLLVCDAAPLPVALHTSLTALMLHTLTLACSTTYKPNGLNATHAHPCLLHYIQARPHL